MRTMVRILAVLVCSATRLMAEQSAPSQTARQALLEMFFSKTPGTLVKHLPAATLAALEKSGAMASLQQYSLLAAQFQTQGQTFQTFEAGPVLLSGTDAKTAQKYEVTAESDRLHGDQDDIEVSFRTYKDGQVQHVAFMPRITFSMKQESQGWTLNEIAVTIRLPLADPDFLKTIMEKAKPQTTPNMTLNSQPQIAGANVTSSPRSQNSMSASGSDSQVLAAMRTILTAETTYAATYPRVGYTCTLSDLDGFGGGEPNEHQAMLINSGLAGGKRYGFVFSLSGCGGAPSTSFHLSGTPNAITSGRKTFCADQSGAIRSSMTGDAEACFAHGTEAQ